MSNSSTDIFETDRSGAGECSPGSPGSVRLSAMTAADATENLSHTFQRASVAPEAYTMFARVSDAQNSREIV